MKKVLFAALFACTQAFAIIGVGAHYVTNWGTLDGAEETLGNGAKLKRAEVDGLQGIGFKVWIDILPVVDIEGTLNIAATRYVPYLEYGSEKMYLEYSPEAPFSLAFDKASPIYGFVSGDLSVTYPLDLIIIRPYAGLGISYMAGMPLVDQKFADKVFTDQNVDLSTPTPEKVNQAFSSALSDTDYTSGIGGHLIVGIRGHLPIIPVAIYTNAKYYFGGNLSSKFSQGVTFELGGGFAI